MKTLIIHPHDPTTVFLTPIYANLKNITVVNGGITKSDLQGLIETHDRVICLGHGSPYGLLNPRIFPDAGLFIVDVSMATSLKSKSGCIYLWCHANQFLTKYGLSGLCSGMFISEPGEADLYGFKGIDYRLIDESNEKFSSILSRFINEPLDTMHRSLLNDYELVAMVNPIARFNLERLYHYTNGINNYLIKAAV